MENSIISYDFEVFSKAKWWCVTFIDVNTNERTTIINNSKQLKEYWSKHQTDIFIGYNNKGYDQWIMKAILLNQNPFKVNDGITMEDKAPYKLVKNYKSIQMINYDISDKIHSLKQYEGFMGSMIKETDVPFDLDRPLTDEEIQQVIFYNIHDVEETIKVLKAKQGDFDSQKLLVEMYNLPLIKLNDTKAQLSAYVLGGVKQHSIDDEFLYDYKLPLNVIQLNKYRYVLDWFLNPRNHTYKRSLVTMIAGVEHTYAFGGVHGAIKNYVSDDNCILVHLDVASLYPSLMIIYHYLSRNVLDPKIFEEIKATRLKFKKMKDKKNKPLKIVINATYGILKDKNNPLYDPCMSNCVCLTGQLLITDLIEKIEGYCKLIQTNTDGLILEIKDEEHFQKVMEAKEEWEQRTGLELECDRYKKLYQRDVNNYILIDMDGNIESKGCVKEKTLIDNDLPIVTKAVINYCNDGTPIEDTINNCNDLIEFQKIVKITKLYDHCFYGDVVKTTHNGKACTIEGEGIKYSEKVFRVYASTRETDKGIYKVKNEYKVEKIANTPDKCFIWNDSVVDVKCPEYLDKQYYINLANDLLNDFLGKNDVKEEKVKPETTVIDVLKKNHNEFYDVLVDIKESKNVTRVNLNNFISIDVFKKYGKANKIMKYNELFNKLYNKKSTKDKTIREITDNEKVFEILRNNSNYNEEKGTFSKLNSEPALREIFNVLEDEDISIFDKIRMEYKLYDDVTIKDENVSDNLLFVMNVNETKNPSIVAYNVKYGSVLLLKIPKDIFSILEIKEQDFIEFKNIYKKPIPKVLGKDKDGINIIGEDEEHFEWWIDKYDIINRDYKKNNPIQYKEGE